MKKAMGYDCEEVVEEYLVEDDVMTLIKKRVSKKHYPPDTQAAKMLLDFIESKDNQNLTDEEIELEIKKLIKKYEEKQE